MWLLAGGLEDLDTSLPVLARQQMTSSIHERTCAQVNNVEVKQLEVLRFRFSRHVSHVWTFRPLCSLLFSLSSFYAGHDPRVILFVSPLVLLPEADLPKNHNQGVVRYCCAVSRCAPMTLCKCCESCLNDNARKNKFQCWKQRFFESLGHPWRLENFALRPRTTGHSYRPLLSWITTFEGKWEIISQDRIPARYFQGRFNYCHRKNQSAANSVAAHGRDGPTAEAALVCRLAAGRVADASVGSASM